MDELPDPFDVYVRSVEVQWTTIETASLMAPLGLALPAASARQIAADDVHDENEAIAGRSVRAATWFRSLAHAERAMRAYARLSNESEWYPPLVLWRRRGDQLACVLQQALTGLVERAANDISILEAHTSEHGALMKQRGEYVKTAEALAAQLDQLASRLDAPETWPPLLAWQIAARTACDQAKQSLSEHSGRVASELQALQVLHVRYEDLLKEYLATTRNLESEFAQQQRNGVALDVALREADRQHGRAQWAAFLAALRTSFLGFLAGGFAGCAYGCENAKVSAGDGLVMGGILAALAGFVIGIISEYSNVTRRSAEIATIQQRVYDTGVASAQAYASLERHRALMPSRLARP